MNSNHASANRFSRRAFLASTAMSLAGKMLGQETNSGRTGTPIAKSKTSGKRSTNVLDLAMMPNFCAHEHWGSIDSIGVVAEGFRADVECGATPKTRTGIFDILLDPYFKGFLKSGSANEIPQITEASSFRELRDQAPEQAMKALRPQIKQQQFTGTYQCIRRGLLELYGIDLSTEDSQALNLLQEAIDNNYGHLFEWYRAGMKKAHFSELIRPVQPEYYFRDESTESARDESALTHTLLRVDPLLEFWRKNSPRRDSLARVMGIEPREANSWRVFIGKLFDVASQKKALGIKQIQAYLRRLDYVPREDSEVTWAGDLTPGQVTVFQDWVMHECCRQANDRNWVHQIHVGTHNLGQSSPLPLDSLGKRYPKMKIIMIHCWPFLSESGFLAKSYPNFYMDTCWQLILNPSFFREAMSLWLNYVPLHKMTCSHDATSLEMAVGSSLFTREILTEVLPERAQRLGLSDLDLRRVAQDFLHNNSVAIYGVGKRIEV